MSQVSPKFTVVKDDQSAKQKVPFENSEATHLSIKLATRPLTKSSDSNETRNKITTPRLRPSTVPATIDESNISKCHDDFKSQHSTFTASFSPTDPVPRIHKLGVIPSYLKKETKASVESEFIAKYRKFKLELKELQRMQTNFKKTHEHLKILKAKFKGFGGRDLKLENFEVINFTKNCGDGFNLDTGGRDGEQRSSSDSVSQKYEFNALLIADIERKILQIREADDEFRNKVIKANVEILSQLKRSGNRDIQRRSSKIFKKIDEDWNCLTNLKEMSVELLLQNLLQLKGPFMQETSGIETSNEKTTCSRNETENIQIHDDLQRQIIDLKKQSEALRSEINAKDRQIESLQCNREATDNQEALRSEIMDKEAIINEYNAKFDQFLKQQRSYEAKIKKLEERIARFNDDLRENLIKNEANLSEKQNRCEALERKLEEMSSYRGGGHSTQLEAANEDIKELQYKLERRVKQIHALKQILISEGNKLKGLEGLQQKYEELRHQESCRAQEMNHLKETLSLQTDTINRQKEAISELKSMLPNQSTENADASRDDVNTHHDGNVWKLSRQEKIIEKLEDNKIRSNVLRDQLLERISGLERENEEMKTQIRKFHADFTINRYMYDEQRRKKRLAEILVKKIEK